MTQHLFSLTFNLIVSLLMSKRVLLWFRNDLRIHDNPLVHHLPTNGAKAEVLCLYCFDPRHFEKTPYQSLKTGYHRSKFLIESVLNVKKNLRDMVGIDLLVALNRPEVTIENIVRSLENKDGIKIDVWVQAEVTYEEIKVEQEVEKVLSKYANGGKLIKIPNLTTLYHPQDVPYQYNKVFYDLPDTFTVYREKVEKSAKIRGMLPTVQKGQLIPFNSNTIDAMQNAKVFNETCSFNFIPSLPMLGFPEVTSSSSSNEKAIRGVMEFIGGEDAAKKRIEEWMFRDDNLKDYFDIRNGMLGEAYSSKLSPWLALGCISPRYIYTQVKQYEKDRRISNKSTYWLIFELIWRDFFRFLCTKYGNKIFFSGGVKGMDRDWNYDTNAIERWKNGTTGVPLVDANMRELMQTGWMSNRGRQNVASYLVLDLGIDWRIGADHFESYLLDHDVCSNYGNWNAAAGLTGGRLNKFNMVKQSKDYDPNGEYIRYWIPELKKVPAPLIFEPHLMSKKDQERYGVQIGLHYPNPIVIMKGSKDTKQYPNRRQKSIKSWIKKESGPSYEKASSSYQAIDDSISEFPPLNNVTSEGEKMIQSDVMDTKANPTDDGKKRKSKVQHY